MKKAFFRVLGTAHGVAGLGTLIAIVFLISRHGVATLAQGQFAVVGILCGAIMLASLVACGVTTWLRPRAAPSLAWLAAAAYVATPLLQNFLQFGNALFGNLISNFYYSSAIRLVAALLLTILGTQFGGRANNSFKPKPLRGSA